MDRGMARYQERAAKAEQELREFKAKAQPIERLLAHTVLISAALNILMKRDLLSEFSKEVSRLEAIAAGPEHTNGNQGDAA